jgi:3,4-dihydroxy 2-butanone 4-phosphate synthase/GTP cyclohydrolase II
MQLQAALKMLEAAGTGVVVYLRQEGRGIGLVNKLKAYSLQDMGFDTVEANERLGFPADLRDYGMGAQMLNDLGVKQIRLITNNPRKIAGLKGYGLEVVDRLPLFIEANDYNSEYLATKAEKLGHLLLQTYLTTVAIAWGNETITDEERYEKLDKLRYLARDFNLSLQEESRPVAVALFSKAALIFHIGFDRQQSVEKDWYKDKSNLYLQSISQILDRIAANFVVDRLEFLISCGEDPMTGLQIKLDRKNDRLNLSPSTICHSLETQTIYSLSR